MQDINQKYFQDKTWLIYGRLPNIPKKESRMAIQQRGGRMITSVSGKLNYLVMPGPTPQPSKVVGFEKIVKALSVGAKLVGESDFIRLLQGEDPFVDDGIPEALEPFAEPLVSIHYPSEQVDIDSTYFEKKQWYVYGSILDEHGYPLSKSSLRYIRNDKASPLKLTTKLEKANYIAYERETPLLGARLPKELQIARDEGTPIFGAEDFLLLLHDQRPRSPAPEEPTLHDKLRELRILLHSLEGSLDGKTWSKVQQLLNEMELDEQELAIGYVHAHLEQLSPEARQDAEISEHDDGKWLSKATAGEDLPVLQLVRTVKVIDKLTKVQAQNLLSCKHLKNIEHYKLCTSPPVPQKHWEFLAQATHIPPLKTLELSNQQFAKKSATFVSEAEHLQSVTTLTLRCAGFKKGAASIFFAPGTFPQLKTLDLQSTSYEGAELYEALSHSDAPKITTLLCTSTSHRTSTPSPGLLQFLKSEAARTLRHLSIEGSVEADRLALLKSPALEQLESLAIQFENTHYHSELDSSESPFWRSDRLTKLKRLKLRLLSKKDTAFFKYLLSESPLAASLEELELYIWDSYDLPKDWLLEGFKAAKMPNLRRIRIQFEDRELPDFPLREYFPQLEVEEYVDSSFSQRRTRFRKIISHT